jgi:hypothetical protein
MRERERERENRERGVCNRTYSVKKPPRSKKKKKKNEEQRTTHALVHCILVRCNAPLF